MAKPKGEKAFDNAVRVLCDKGWHARYTAMCAKLGINKSEHVREMMDAELVAFEKTGKAAK